MNTIRTVFPPIAFRGAPLHTNRIVVLAVFLALLVLPNNWGSAMRQAFIDGYTSVAVFVYATLLFFYWFETRFKHNIVDEIGKRAKSQVFFSALLGMTPGCGGAILVVTGYASGRLSFGALTATLTATMGDAAFLLIAERPLAAAVILPLSLIVGTITGMLVDLFYKPKTAQDQDVAYHDVAYYIGRKRARDWVMLAFFIPGIIVGVLGLFDVPLPAWADQFSLAGMIVTVLIWAFSPVERLTNPRDTPLTRANEETAFVMVYVVTAFALFEISQQVFGFDLVSLFSGLAIWMPLIATLVGFVPGCGPQIITTTLYLNGAIPFGALAANAISNDGDALFPALAIAPRDAMVATVITAIPALIVGYGFFFFFPLFMNG